MSELNYNIAVVERQLEDLARAPARSKNVLPEDGGVAIKTEMEKHRKELDKLRKILDPSDNEVLKKFKLISLIAGLQERYNECQVIECRKRKGNGSFASSSGKKHC